MKIFSKRILFNIIYISKQFKCSLIYYWTLFTFLIYLNLKTYCRDNNLLLFYENIYFMFLRFNYKIVYLYIEQNKQNSF